MPEARPESRPDADDGLALNRALWDVRARIHGSTPTDRFYDVESFVAGRQTLYALERELAGDVAGKDLLHLQCHFGMDTLSWARLGARVTGVDFAPAAIERARLLAGRTGLDATFVEADTQRLPESLAAGFDLVVATCSAGSPTPTPGCAVRRWRCAPEAAWSWSICIRRSRRSPPSIRWSSTGPTAAASRTARRSPAPTPNRA
ncbi:class I SAM-dependent methyltransferase [Streptomyces sp. NPDC091273]|uniref:class I SAM-dependent methyltransferase n=1 Tax=Streptomyces sp. NPDC091273 TaxID=3365982 RepID=UPI0038205E36